MNLVSRLLAGLSVVAFALPLAIPAQAAQKGEGYKRLMHTGNSPGFIDFSSKRQKQTSQRVKKRTQPAAQPEETVAGGGEAEATDELVVYRPEELVTLKLLKFEGVAPAEPLAAAIQAELLEPANALRVTAAERKAILADYQARGFKPLWTGAGGLTPRAREVLDVLAKSGEEAMQPADYLPNALGSFDDDGASLGNDPARLARLDLGLTAMALKYARDASGGRLIPDRLTLYNDLKPERVDPANAMKILAFSPYVAAWLKQQQPQHPAYAKLKEAYLALRGAGDLDTSPIPAGNRVKLGQTDRRLPAVRKALMGLGFHEAEFRVETEGLPPAARERALARETVLDSSLANAIKAFQAKVNLKPTGTLEPATVTALNQHSPRENLDRLAINMDRMRWLPKNMGERHVLMNQPAFELRVIDKGRQVWRTNVIIGKPQTQTVAFHDEMETVVFNPSWGVPQSIIAKEMLPILRKDPSYLDRNGYRVILPNGKIVKSRSIDWSVYGNKIPLSVQQPPSGDNALGEIKFLFPNTHNIYMHDTPTRALFAKPVRTFSHGCVRVENPREFATHVLGLDRKEVDSRIDSGESTTVRLKHKLPVHLVYFTAWPDEHGRIVYYNDIYGRDARMEKAYNEIAVAAK
ncbi:MAG: L,D-transpeptidase family protein [Rhizobiales bacterium]|nr:L,D-transpeptidase family protein [Hyphomicrobiales bacterium]